MAHPVMTDGQTEVHERIAEAKLMPANEELIGEYVYTVWPKSPPDDSEYHITIGRLSDGTTVKGKTRVGDFSLDRTYLFFGHWAVHPEYGKQFLFSSCAVTTPTSKRGILHYLCTVPGWGMSRAKKVWDLYGTDSLKAIHVTPDGVIRAVDGVSSELVHRAKEMLDNNSARLTLKTELMGLFAGRGFPHHLDELCIQKWGANAPEEIKKNPYPLTIFRGVGFLTADRLYIDLGLDPAAIIRQGMCLWYSVFSDKEGHVWFPAAQAGRFLRQSITGPLKPTEALEWALENGRLVSREEDGQTWVATTSLAAHEANIVNCLHKAADASTAWPEIQGTEADDDGEPSLHQAEHLSLAMRGRIGILTGGPGTGKTFVLAALIRQFPLTSLTDRFAASSSPARIVVCAPTGKAAVRITESLAAQGITMQARTIHSILGVLSMEGGVWQFEHDADNPLTCDFIFVDEVSMVDAPLMAALLVARGSAHILFLGDVSQLSPVGPGAPLRDMIAAGVPTGRLTETRRNAGQIVESCALIRVEQRMEWSVALDPGIGKNLVHREHDDPDAQIAEVFKQLDRAKMEYRLDPVWDVQILVPVNEKSPLARVTLNVFLRDRLNSTGKEVNGNPFRVGDKIICLENGPYTVLSGPKDDEGKTRVANGGLARVEAVTSSTVTARLGSPDRTIRIPKGKSTEKNTGCAWQLGYAISTHKSQGSEWPVVLIVIDSYPGAVMLCDRHWITTAISRPTLYGVTIGQASVVQGMCRKSHLWKRKTFLVEDLRDLQMTDMVSFFKTQIGVAENGTQSITAETEESHG